MILVGAGGDTMIGKYKRRVAPFLVIGLPLLIFGSAAPDLTMEQSSNVDVVALVLIGFGLHYWARAKGHSGMFGALAILPPVGIVVLALLRDRAAGASPGAVGGNEELQGPEPTKHCPSCGAPYRESEYGDNPVVMICSQCRNALPTRLAVAARLRS